VNGGGGTTLASLAVGGDGPGFVDVRHGSLLRVLGEARVGVLPGPGFVVVDGTTGAAFTTWQSDGPLLVGTDAEATVDVLSSGRLSAPSLQLGVNPSGVGALTVAGFAGRTPRPSRSRDSSTSAWPASAPSRSRTAPYVPMGSGSHATSTPKVPFASQVGSGSSR